MRKKTLRALVFLLSICWGINQSLAEDFSSIRTQELVDLNPLSSEVSINFKHPSCNIKTINLGKNDSSYTLTNATDRFVQCNIRASWEDFRNIINSSIPNDFTYISYMNKMADLGLFDLADLSAQKIRDNSMSDFSIESIKRFYYPKKVLKMDDELALAEIYSNILYNDQGEEALKDLLNRKDLLSNYDYANYVAALGFHKTQNYSKAIKYINYAMAKNPSNLNYQKLKAQILAENKSSEALRVVQNMKKQENISYEFLRKIKSLEQFVMYKIKTAQWEKNYHLGYYHHLENDDSKAISTLQLALSCKKKSDCGRVYALMSQIYFNMKEYDKAQDTAQKAYKISKNYPQALITLGDLNYKNGKYPLALKYYKQSAIQDKTSYAPLIREAKTYEKLLDSKKANQLYLKIIKNYPESWEAYYDLANLDNDKNKKIMYIKKSLAINPLFNAGWIELAGLEIEDKNYDNAQKYLANAYNIDENDFRYYYYQGLLSEALGNNEQAKYNFKKCLKLNVNHEKAQQELGKLIFEETQLIQDRI